MFQMGIVDVIFIIVSISLIVLVSLQHTKQGLTESLTGSNSELFKNQKERGAEVYIVRATYILAISFIILGLIVYIK